MTKTPANRPLTSPFLVAVAVLFIGAVVVSVIGVVAQQMNEYHDEAVRNHIVAGGTTVVAIAMVIGYLIQRRRVAARARR